jgi:chromosome segregation protein
VYLKRLEMLGFKSFAARTELEFSPGITAIIGPNGSGKSNIADAIRWVLGEQSMKQLRGKKSEDIIFAGGQGRAALGMSEVTLTLDNASGWLPSEYTEVTVTRRSYRSGENEYLINKSKVRLRDVLLLLAQARVGHDSYTVIGQGLVDAALSLRAEERRSLFEDAAGIRHLQVQRADAETKLTQTEQNLNRLRDIIGEIAPRLAPLAEQARRAQVYAATSAELERQLGRWYAFQWRQAREASERAEAVEAGLAARQRELQAQTAARTAQMAGLYAQREEWQRRQSETRRARGERAARAQDLERDVAVTSERQASLQRQYGELVAERERQQQTLQQSEATAAALTKQLGDTEAATERGAQALETLNAEVERARLAQEQEEARWRAVQREVIGVQARLGAAQSELGRLQRQVGERNRVLAARRQTVAQAGERLAALTGRLQQHQAALDEAHNQEQALAGQRQRLRKANEDAQREFERLRDARAEAQRQRRGVADRLALLRHWQQSLSGYADGVRTLMQAKHTVTLGIVGPLAAFLAAPKGMETAVEAALGPLLQALLVRSADAAAACLRYLDEHGGGAALLVWAVPPGALANGAGDAGDHAGAPMLGEVGGEAYRNGQVSDFTAAGGVGPPPAPIAGSSGKTALEQSTGQEMQAGTAVRDVMGAVSGMAVDVITCAPEHAALFRRLLTGCVIVRDLATARVLLFEERDADEGLRYRRQEFAPTGPSVARGSALQMAVTQAGEVVHRSGWVSGGASDAEGQGALARARELRELPARLEEHDTSIARLDKLIANLRRQQDERAVEQARLEKDLQREGARVAELTRELGAMQREVDRARHDVQVGRTVEQDLAAEIAGLEQELHATEVRVAEQERLQREAAARADAMQRAVEASGARYRALQEEVHRQRTSLAVQRQEQKALAQRLEQQQAQAREAQARLERYHERAAEFTRQQEEAACAIQRQRAELEQVRAQIQQLTAEVRRAEEAYNEVEQALRALDRQDAEERQALTRLEVEYRRCLVERQRCQDTLDHLRTQLREELGLGEAPAGDLEAIDARDLRRTIDDLRSRLKDLGGCDPNAPREYEETRVRYEFLTGQVRDMEHASEALRKVIADLDERMKRQFAVTFQEVNERFGRHFTTLFRGGQARLELTPPRDGETHSGPVGGVDIIVQPPGKRVQDLALLSGGERALVSAALLFALLETNPPPFCLLDEVDAALDESNVTRFCDILNVLAERTQFIVITHNRVTMTAAQAIYGISMGADSVSRMLSLRLADVPA